MSFDAESDAVEPAPRRFRSFVARVPQPADAAATTQTSAQSVELPVLTEVVAAPLEPPPLAPAALFDHLHSELSSALSAWLAEALPAAVAQASQQILDVLDHQARQTLLPQLEAILEDLRATYSDSSSPD